MPLPWSDRHARVHQGLRAPRNGQGQGQGQGQSQGLGRRGEAILLAVSGGQDSLCLAQVMLELQPRWDWRLAIAHCDHGWRQDSSANAAHVARLARVWGLPLLGARATVPLLGEAAAREWRYRVLLELAEQHHFGAIATGHTASDRAETLLYNLTRGAGLEGLSALGETRWLSPEVRLLRPLLCLTRADTEAFCRERQLPVWEDSTNQDLRYARNRIRHQVLPVLQGLNPRADEHLAQTAELIEAEVEYLDHQACNLLEKVMVEDRLQRRQLHQAPLALQRRVLRLFLTQVTQSEQTPSFTQVEKLVRLLDAPNRSQTDPFPGGQIAIAQGDWLYLQPPAQS